MTHITKIPAFAISGRGRRTRACACLALLFALTGRVTADLITFANRSIDNLVLAGTQTEGAFQYKATTGPGWEVQAVYGRPPSALVTFFNNESSSDGDTVIITRVGGGLFTFNSVDYATIDAAQSDHVALIGFLGGGQTAVLALNTSTPSNTIFVTVPSGFSGPVDQLLVQVSLGSQNNALLMDNFNLTVVVPEPSAAAMLALGGLALLVCWPRRGRSFGTVRTSR